MVNYTGIILILVSIPVGAKDNAFNIRYGVDMMAIDETVDYSEFCSTLIAEDNFPEIVLKYIQYQIRHHIAM